MKLLMLATLDKNEDIFAGVFKKVIGQTKAFKNAGFPCIFSYIQNNYVIFEDQSNDDIYKVGYGSNKSYYEVISNVIIQEQITHIYIRKPWINYNFIDFLKKLRYLGQMKVILEIPTYPYDYEKMNPIFRDIDKYYRRQMVGLVDLVVNYHGYDEIFCLPAISIENGGDFSDVEISENTKENLKEINLIMVASFADWHGLDRMVEGLGLYYKGKSEEKVILHLVGSEQNQGVISLARAISKKFGIEDKIVLYGFKTGEELDDIFKDKDLAIASLGLHRINLKSGSTLKEQEYYARGLPVVASYKNNLTDKKDFLYRLELVADDSPVNINEIISYLNKINQDKDHKQEIRKFAEENYSWDNSLTPVIKWIKNNS